MPSINADRWRVLSPYLDEALDIPADQRAAWLTSIAGRDPMLAEDLRTILAEHRTVHESKFLEHTVLEPRATPLASLTGHVLGAYRLLSPIGQGGTGSVWLAERSDGRFEGRAAVKLLNISLIGRAGEERFTREGNILARLRHPRIAHLIDAGVSSTGQPYLVIEHVDGQTIDRYCDQRGLGVEGRLRLFLDVVDAVAHAHANLIVHRDIKPANVLVSKEGAVKLLDFGIAKLVERDVAWGSTTGNASALTREGGAVLTPEYAAPEQLSGGAVTTATDIYALGVLLYVLLTGRHPAGEALHSPATLIRAIVDRDPVRASDAVVSAADDPHSSARHATARDTTPAKLRRLLRGDLDTIVWKAMQKSASERYSSVTALADDIQRYLRREPINARPASVRYRTVTFVRRHATAVTAVTAVLLLVAGLTIVHTRRLAAERDHAQRETAKAVKVSEMLMGVLTSVDPYTIRGQSGEPTLRALLDGGATQVRKQLVEQPELQAQMLTSMGRTYRRLAEYETAQHLLEEALAIGRRVYGPEHARIAETLGYLGGVLADRGDYAGAARDLEQAIAMRRHVLGPEHEDVAVTLAELGRVYQDEGLNERAEPLHREALAIRRKRLGNDHRETAVSLSDLASVLRLNGDLDRAELLLQQCLDLNRKTRGEDHPNTSTTLHDLALIAATRGEYRAAEAQFREVLSTQRATLGERHPVVATTLNSLSHVLAADHRNDEAASALAEALDIARASLGNDHQLVGIYSINLGAVQLARNNPSEAEALVREGLRIRTQAPEIVPSRRRTLIEDDWSIGATKSLLGAVLLSRHRYAEAEGVLLDARTDLASVRTPQPLAMKATIARLVALYDAWGKRDRAATYRALLGT